MAEIYLVKQGQGNIYSLTESGRLHAEGVRDDLVKRDLGCSALILCAKVQPAEMTASIIASGLGIKKTYRSFAMHTSSNHLKAVANLDNIIEVGLQEYLVTQPPDQLIVVMHKNLISIAVCGELNGLLAEGSAYRYEPGSWANPYYDRHAAATVKFESELGIL